MAKGGKNPGVAAIAVAWNHSAKAKQKAKQTRAGSIGCATWILTMARLCHFLANFEIEYLRANCACPA